MCVWLFIICVSQISSLLSFFLLPSTSRPPPRRWEADLGWAASLGSHMPTGQNSFPEVMDVSGLVSSCYLSSYRHGCFHNDVDSRWNVSQSSGGAYQFKTAHFSFYIWWWTVYCQIVHRVKNVPMNYYLCELWVIIYAWWYKHVKD